MMMQIGVDDGASSSDAPDKVLSTGDFPLVSADLSVCSDVF